VLIDKDFALRAPGSLAKDEAVHIILRYLKLSCFIFRKDDL
jgi:hypothetical protein